MPHYLKYKPLTFWPLHQNEWWISFVYCRSVCAIFFSFFIFLDSFLSFYFFFCSWWVCRFIVLILCSMQLRNILFGGTRKSHNIWFWLFDYFLNGSTSKTTYKYISNRYCGEWLTAVASSSIHELNLYCAFKCFFHHFHSDWFSYFFCVII